MGGWPGRLQRLLTSRSAADETDITAHLSQVLFPGTEPLTDGQRLMVSFYEGQFKRFDALRPCSPVGDVPVVLPTTLVNYVRDALGSVSEGLLEALLSSLRRRGDVSAVLYAAQVAWACREGDDKEVRALLAGSREKPGPVLPEEAARSYDMLVSAYEGGGQR